MIEKHIVLEDIDPVILYGAGNNHLQMIRALFPKLRIVARDNVIRVLGDEEQMCAFEENIETMRRHVLKFNRIGEEDILEIVKGKKTANEMPEGVVVYTMAGKPVKPRSEKQQQLVDAFNKSDMVFAVGPAGTGKTYLSIALAVKDRPVSPTTLRRPGGHAPGGKVAGHDGETCDTDSPFGIYAWPNTQRRHCHPRRGTKHHLRPTQDVPHPNGMELQNDNYRRHDTD